MIAVIDPIDLLPLLPVAILMIFLCTGVLMVSDAKQQRDEQLSNTLASMERAKQHTQRTLEALDRAHKRSVEQMAEIDRLDGREVEPCTCNICSPPPVPEAIHDIVAPPGYQLARHLPDWAWERWLRRHT